MLLKILMQRRADVRVTANFLLRNIDPLRDLIVPFNTSGKYAVKKASLTALEAAISHVREGHGLAMFPAGEVSAYQSGSGLITDREWQEPVLRAMKAAEVPVIPVYFHGTNSRWFHILGRIHPLLAPLSLAPSS
ncbi:MAG: hypothetical protein R2758_04755 [Bacteroidales bacterium]